MTFETLKQAVKDNKYQPKYVKIPQKIPADHVFDENLTVRENRQMLAQYNESRSAAFAKRRTIENEMFKKFLNDLKAVLMNEFVVTTRQADKIANVAYSESHSTGYLEVVQTAYDIASLYKELQELA